jgi:hypothetical protein
MSNLSLFTNLLSNPPQAFAALKERPNFLLPMLAILLAMAGYQLLYFTLVDYSWLIDQMVAQVNAQGGDPAAAEGIRNVPKTLMMVPGIIGGVIGLLVMQSIYAAYLMLVAKVNGDGFGFKAMFSLSWWASVPILFTLIASAVYVLMADEGRVFFDSANPFSLNSLIFNVDIANPFRGLLTNIDVFAFWAWALATIGYKQFSGRSYLGSALIALAPHIVIYGIWILIAAL